MAENGAGAKPPTDKPKRKQEPTEYVLLQLEQGGSFRKLEKTIKAATIQAAISVAAGEDGGTFVAVPARSWKPLTLKVEQVPKRSFEEVTL